MRQNWTDDKNSEEGARSERVPNTTSKYYNNNNNEYGGGTNSRPTTNQLSTRRNTVKPDGIIDETELRYIRDSIAFNSFPNPNALSREEESNSYLYVAFPS